MAPLLVMGALIMDFDTTRFSGGVRMKWEDESHVFLEVSGQAAHAISEGLKPAIASDRCRKIRIQYREPLLLSLPESDEEFCTFFATAGGHLGLTDRAPLEGERGTSRETPNETPWTRAKMQDGVLTVWNPTSTDLLVTAPKDVCESYRTRRGGVQTRCKFKLPKEWLR